MTVRYELVLYLLGLGLVLVFGVAEAAAEALGLADGSVLAEAAADALAAGVAVADGDGLAGADAFGVMAADGLTVGEFWTLPVGVQPARIAAVSRTAAIRVISLFIMVSPLFIID